MFICPVCDKVFSSEFAMKGHLRLSTDYRHVAYTDKKVSRKHVRVASANLSKQTHDDLLARIFNLESKFDAMVKSHSQPLINTKNFMKSLELLMQKYDTLLERISYLEAKVDGLNKPQQQPVTKTATPVLSLNLSQSPLEILADKLLQQEAKDNVQNKPPQQIGIKTEAPDVPHSVTQPKSVDWREYTHSDRFSTDPEDYFYSDEELNELIKRGYPPEYVQESAMKKTFRGRQKEKNQY